MKAQHTEAQDPTPISYSRDVRPILSDRCFFCHGPDAERREADLRLDRREDALDYAIVAGKPADSELIHRIESSESDVVMPPPDSNLSLTEPEKEILHRWISEGAQYEKHWAFQSVVAPELRTDEHPIDELVARKLSEHALEPALPADKATLLRRLSFDLTGLPPTLEELEAFISDDSPKAYEKQVDRLLASLRYGERMAVDWLDVARYADTYGYQNDRYRAMWPWRDWVVRAFNDNLPYDEFVRWQLAGDLLPNATQDQILATAFNRNHRQTNEGGSVEEEFRAEYVADRVNTFGAAFLGLTLECARCHDHKYDPISQREYYQLSAYFNSIDESGLYSHFTQATPTPTLQLSTESDQEELARLAEQVMELETQLAATVPSDEEFANWRKQLTDLRPLVGPTTTTELSTEPSTLRGQIEAAIDAATLGDFPLDDLSENKLFNRKTAEREGKVSDAPQLVDSDLGKAVELSGDNGLSVDAGGAFSRHDPFTISIWLRPAEFYERAVIFHRSRAWTDSGSRGYELLLEDGKLSAALIHFWPGNALRVVSREPLPTKTWSKVDFVYDGSSRASGLRLFVDGEAIETVVVRDQLTKHIKGSDGFGGGGSKQLAIGQRFRDNGFKEGQVSRLRVYSKALSDLELQFCYLQDAMPENIREVLYNLAAPPLRAFHRAQHAKVQELSAALTEARKQRGTRNDGIEEIMVMRELPEPRETFLLIRGAYDAPGDRVERGSPRQIAPASDVLDADSTRLDLANWLVSREHPLTARVTVNRIWQSIFGRGLVATSEDFGLQGALPTNPELLDWLAADFMDHGWEVKRMIKNIVMSRTYRQSSNPSPKLLEFDPDNDFLARGPAHRLPAEMIRDAALFASGLLVEKQGGPAVKPYQPAGLWKEKSGQTYQRQEGEGSHRRSLYTYWKRTSPPPAMMSLDSSNREVCVVKRQVTLTPMQILVLLNDPQYVEAARALAEASLFAGAESEVQLTFLFRRLTSRPPEAKELEVLKRMFDEQRSYFAAHPESVDEFLEFGDHRPQTKIDSVSLAALSVVAEGLMSYDESVMKR